MLRDQGIGFDPAEFDRAMEEQRTRARASWKGAHKEVASPAYAKLAETFRTEPDFYFGTSARDCRIEAIVTAGGRVNELPAGAEGEIVLDRTPFYAESGGQIADTGTLWNNERSLELAEVRGAYYPVTGWSRIACWPRRRCAWATAWPATPTPRGASAIKRNHTATHLMHAALRNILGTHVKQAGSLVAPDRLRFDFSHFAAGGSGRTGRHRAAGERADSPERRDRDRRDHASTTRWPPARWPFSATATRSRTCAW